METDIEKDELYYHRWLDKIFKDIEDISLRPRLISTNILRTMAAFIEHLRKYLQNLTPPDEKRKLSDYYLANATIRLLHSFRDLIPDKTDNKYLVPLSEILGGCIALWLRYYWLDDGQYAEKHIKKIFNDLKNFLQSIKDESFLLKVLAHVFFVNKKLPRIFYNMLRDHIKKYVREGHVKEDQLYMLYIIVLKLCAYLKPQGEILEHASRCLHPFTTILSNHRYSPYLRSIKTNDVYDKRATRILLMNNKCQSLHKITEAVVKEDWLKGSSETTPITVDLSSEDEEELELERNRKREETRKRINNKKSKLTNLRLIEMIDLDSEPSRDGFDTNISELDKHPTQEIRKDIVNNTKSKALDETEADIIKITNITARELRLNDETTVEEEPEVVVGVIVRPSTDEQYLADVEKTNVEALKTNEIIANRESCEVIGIEEINEGIPKDLKDKCIQENNKNKSSTNDKNRDELMEINVNTSKDTADITATEIRSNEEDQPEETAEEEEPEVVFELTVKSSSDEQYLEDVETTFVEGLKTIETTAYRESSEVIAMEEEANTETEQMDEEILEEDLKEKCIQENNKNKSSTNDKNSDELLEIEFEKINVNTSKDTADITATEIRSNEEDQPEETAEEDQPEETAEEEEPEVVFELTVKSSSDEQYLEDVETTTFVEGLKTIETTAYRESSEVIAMEEKANTETKQMNEQILKEDLKEKCIQENNKNKSSTNDKNSDELMEIEFEEINVNTSKDTADITATELRSNEEDQPEETAEEGESEVVFQLTVKSSSDKQYLEDLETTFVEGLKTIETTAYRESSEVIAMEEEANTETEQMDEEILEEDLKEKCVQKDNKNKPSNQDKNNDDGSYIEVPKTTDELFTIFSEIDKLHITDIVSNHSALKELTEVSETKTPQSFTAPILQENNTLADCVSTDKAADAAPEISPKLTLLDTQQNSNDKLNPEKIIKANKIILKEANIAIKEASSKCSFLVSDNAMTMEFKKGSQTETVENDAKITQKNFYLENCFNNTGTTAGTTEITEENNKNNENCGHYSLNSKGDNDLPNSLSKDDTIKITSDIEIERNTNNTERLKIDAPTLHTGNDYDDNAIFVSDIVNKNSDSKIDGIHTDKISSHVKEKSQVNLRQCPPHAPIIFSLRRSKLFHVAKYHDNCDKLTDQHDCVVFSTNATSMREKKLFSPSNCCSPLSEHNHQPNSPAEGDEIKFRFGTANYAENDSVTDDVKPTINRQANPTVIANRINEVIRKRSIPPEEDGNIQCENITSSTKRKAPLTLKGEQIDSSQTVPTAEVLESPINSPSTSSQNEKDQDLNISSTSEIKSFDSPSNSHIKDLSITQNMFRIETDSQLLVCVDDAVDGHPEILHNKFYEKANNSISAADFSTNSNSSKNRTICDGAVDRHPEILHNKCYEKPNNSISAADFSTNSNSSKNRTVCDDDAVGRHPEILHNKCYEKANNSISTADFSTNSNSSKIRTVCDDDAVDRHPELLHNECYEKDNNSISAADFSTNSNSSKNRTVCDDDAVGRHPEILHNKCYEKANNSISAADFSTNSNSSKNRTVCDDAAVDRHPELLHNKCYEKDNNSISAADFSTNSNSSKNRTVCDDAVDRHPEILHNKCYEKANNSISAADFSTNSNSSKNRTVCDDAAVDRHPELLHNKCYEKANNSISAADFSTNSNSSKNRTVCDDAAVDRHPELLHNKCYEKDNNSISAADFSTNSNSSKNRTVCDDAVDRHPEILHNKCYEKANNSISAADFSTNSNSSKNRTVCDDAAVDRHPELLHNKCYEKDNNSISAADFSTNSNFSKNRTVCDDAAVDRHPELLHNKCYEKANNSISAADFSTNSNSSKIRTVCDDDAVDRHPELLHNKCYEKDNNSISAADFSTNSNSSKIRTVCDDAAVDRHPELLHNKCYEKDNNSISAADFSTNSNFSKNRTVCDDAAVDRHPKILHNKCYEKANNSISAADLSTNSNPSKNRTNMFDNNLVATSENQLTNEEYAKMILDYFGDESDKSEEKKVQYSLPLKKRRTLSHDDAAVFEEPCKENNIKKSSEYDDQDKNIAYGAERCISILQVADEIFPFLENKNPNKFSKAVTNSPLQQTTLTDARAFNIISQLKENSQAFSENIHANITFQTEISNCREGNTSNHANENIEINFPYPEKLTNLEYLLSKENPYNFPYRMDQNVEQSNDPNSFGCHLRSNYLPNNNSQSNTNQNVNSQGDLSLPFSVNNSGVMPNPQEGNIGQMVEYLNDRNNLSYPLNTNLIQSNDFHGEINKFNFSISSGMTENNTNRSTVENIHPQNDMNKYNCSLSPNESTPNAQLNMIEYEYESEKDTFNYSDSSNDTIQNMQDFEIRCNINNVSSFTSNHKGIYQFPSNHEQIDNANNQISENSETWSNCSSNDDDINTDNYDLNLGHMNNYYHKSRGNFAKKYIIKKDDDLDDRFYIRSKHDAAPNINQNPAEPVEQEQTTKKLKKRRENLATDRETRITNKLGLVNYREEESNTEFPTDINNFISSKTCIYQSKNLLANRKKNRKLKGKIPSNHTQPYSPNSSRKVSKKSVPSSSCNSNDLASNSAKVSSNQTESNKLQNSENTKGGTPKTSQQPVQAGTKDCKLQEKIPSNHTQPCSHNSSKTIGKISVASSSSSSKNDLASNSTGVCSNQTESKKLQNSENTKGEIPKISQPAQQAGTKDCKLQKTILSNHTQPYSHNSSKTIGKISVASSGCSSKNDLVSNATGACSNQTESKKLQNSENTKGETPKTSQQTVQAGTKDCKLQKTILSNHTQPYSHNSSKNIGKISVASGGCSSKNDLVSNSTGACSNHTESKKLQNSENTKGGTPKTSQQPVQAGTKDCKLQEKIPSNHIQPCSHNSSKTIGKISVASSSSSSKNDLASNSTGVCSNQTESKKLQYSENTKGEIPKTNQQPVQAGTKDCKLQKTILSNHTQPYSHNSSKTIGKISVASSGCSSKNDLVSNATGACSNQAESNKLQNSANTKGETLKLIQPAQQAGTKDCKLQKTILSNHTQPYSHNSSKTIGKISVASSGCSSKNDLVSNATGACSNQTESKKLQNSENTKGETPKTSQQTVQAGTKDCKLQKTILSNHTQPYSHNSSKTIGKICVASSGCSSKNDLVSNSTGACSNQTESKKLQNSENTKGEPPKTSQQTVQAGTKDCKLQKKILSNHTQPYSHNSSKNIGKISVASCSYNSNNDLASNSTAVCSNQVESNKSQNSENTKGETPKICQPAQQAGTKRCKLQGKILSNQTQPYSHNSSKTIGKISVASSGCSSKNDLVSNATGACSTQTESKKLQNSENTKGETPKTSQQTVQAGTKRCKLQGKILSNYTQPYSHNSSKKIGKISVASCSYNSNNDLASNSIDVCSNQAESNKSQNSENIKGETPKISQPALQAGTKRCKLQGKILSNYTQPYSHNSNKTIGKISVASSGCSSKNDHVSKTTGACSNQAESNKSQNSENTKGETPKTSQQTVQAGTKDCKPQKMILSNHTQPFSHNSSKNIGKISVASCSYNSNNDLASNSIDVCSNQAESNKSQNSENIKEETPKITQPALQAGTKRCKLQGKILSNHTQPYSHNSSKTIGKISVASSGCSSKNDHVSKTTGACSNQAESNKSQNSENTKGETPKTSQQTVQAGTKDCKLQKMILSNHTQPYSHNSSKNIGKISVASCSYNSNNDLASNSIDVCSNQAKSNKSQNSENIKGETPKISQPALQAGTKRCKLQGKILSNHTQPYSHNSSKTIGKISVASSGCSSKNDLVSNAPGAFSNQAESNKLQNSANTKGETPKISQPAQQAGTKDCKLQKTILSNHTQPYSYNSSKKSSKISVASSTSNTDLASKSTEVCSNQTESNKLQNSQNIKRKTLNSSPLTLQAGTKRCKLQDKILSNHTQPYSHNSSKKVSKRSLSLSSCSSNNDLASNSTEVCSNQTESNKTQNSENIKGETPKISQPAQQAGTKRCKLQIKILSNHTQPCSHNSSKTIGKISVASSTSNTDLASKSTEVCSNQTESNKLQISQNIKRKTLNSIPLTLQAGTKRCKLQDKILSNHTQPYSHNSSKKVSKRSLSSSSCSFNNDLASNSTEVCSNQTKSNELENSENTKGETPNSSQSPVQTGDVIENNLLSTNDLDSTEEELKNILILKKASDERLKEKLAGINMSHYNLNLTHLNFYHQNKQVNFAKKCAILQTDIVTEDTSVMQNKDESQPYSNEIAPKCEMNKAEKRGRQLNSNMNRYRRSRRLKRPLNYREQ